MSITTTSRRSPTACRPAPDRGACRLAFGSPAPDRRAARSSRAHLRHRTGRHLLPVSLAAETPETGSRPGSNQLGHRMNKPLGGDFDHISRSFSALIGFVASLRLPPERAPSGASGSSAASNAECGRRRLPAAAGSRAKEQRGNLLVIRPKSPWSQSGGSKLQQVLVAPISVAVRQLRTTRGRNASRPRPGSPVEVLEI